ncbi:MAG: zinc-dependent metalloprotease [Bacteroidetes bacterium]|nr:zinc-dependent metalloprotease [Bacteroidota bacterium]
MRILFSTIAAFVVLNAAAQDDHFRCGTTEMQDKWFAEHPELKAEFDRLQQEAAELDREMYKNNYGQQNTNQQKTTAASLYTIPVVFHILHTDGEENISNAQVINAVNILTRDFNKLNADIANVVGAFQGITGNAQIEFRLATKDPQGNCTNGIIRHYDANTNWTGTPSEYIYTWDRTRYMNVYVVKSIASGAAGYTNYPGVFDAIRDAIVILHSYVGSIGTGNVQRSRALTHEVGHWLNLQHVWGNNNNPGQVCGDDGVSDTPITKGHTSCNLSSASCGNGVENVQNYMDYSYCSNMFTTGQAARMTTAINSNVNFSARSNLSSVTNLFFTGITAPGCPRFDIAVQPSAVVCLGQPLSFATQTFNNIAPTSYEWSATNSANIINVNSPSTPITFYTAGEAVVSCTIINENGVAEVQNTTVYVQNSVPEVTHAYREGFEESHEFPAGWRAISMNSTTDWVLSYDGAYDGAVSTMVQGELAAPNSTLILESPSFDFLNNPDATFTFYYAYARQSSQHQDRLRLQATMDCGATWKNVWVANLVTAANSSGGITSELFYPQPEHWIYHDITNIAAFNQFKNQESVRFRFVFVENQNGSGSGNRLYLDEINFTGREVEVEDDTAINELAKAIRLNVYPNPASSEAKIRFTLADAALIKYSVTHITGALLVETAVSTYTPGKHDINISTEKLQSGIYFVNLELNGVKLTKKLLVNH